MNELSNALELDKLSHGHVKGSCDANEDINADVGRSCLNLPEIGTADSRHEGKLSLRDALLGANSPDPGAQTSLFAHVIHVLSIRAV